MSDSSSSHHRDFPFTMRCLKVIGTGQHTHKNAHTHTRTNTHMHTHTHMYKQTCTNTCTHTCWALNPSYNQSHFHFPNACNLKSTSGTINVDVCPLVWQTPPPPAACQVILYVVVLLQYIMPTLLYLVWLKVVHQDK